MTKDIQLDRSVSTYIIYSDDVPMYININYVIYVYIYFNIHAYMLGFVVMPLALSLSTTHMHTKCESLRRGISYLYFYFILSAACQRVHTTRDVKTLSEEWLISPFPLHFLSVWQIFPRALYPRTYKYILYICLRFCVSNTFRKNSLLLQDKTRCQRDVILYQTHNIDLFHFIIFNNVAI